MAAGYSEQNGIVIGDLSVSDCSVILGKEGIFCMLEKSIGICLVYPVDTLHYI